MAVENVYDEQGKVIGRRLYDEPAALVFMEMFAWVFNRIEGLTDRLRQEPAPELFTIQNLRSLTSLGYCPLELESVLVPVEIEAFPLTEDDSAVTQRPSLFAVVSGDRGQEEPALVYCAPTSQQVKILGEKAAQGGCSITWFSGDIQRVLDVVNHHQNRG